MFFGRSQTEWLDIKRRRPESSYPPPSSSAFRSSTIGNGGPIAWRAHAPSNTSARYAPRLSQIRQADISTQGTHLSLSNAR